MAVSARAVRLLKVMDHITTKTFDRSAVLDKFKVHSASDGIIKGSFVVDTTMCNTGGTLHGGYIASVIDVISFYTQLTSPYAKASWTTNLNVNYVGGANEGETVNVEAKSVKSGQFGVIETCFHNEKGVLLAKGTASFLAASEKFQKLMKDRLQFDVYEN